MPSIYKATINGVVQHSLFRLHIAYAQIIGNVDTEPSQETGKIIGPRKCHINVAETVFHDQRPADDPRDHFTKGRISIGISAACGGYSTGKFGIAKRGEATGKTADHIENDNAGTSSENRFAKTAETAGTYDGGNSKEDNVPSTQDAFQLSRFGVGVVFPSEEFIHSDFLKETNVKEK